MDQNNRWTFVIVGVILALIALPIGALAIMVAGRVEGTEFSPQTFSTRHFYYVRFPIFHGRITQTVQGTPKSCSPQILNHIKTGNNVRWDLESLQMGSDFRSKRRAAICTQYVFENGEWESWTSDHSELAGLLWPAVQELALENCYFAIPELLKLAKLHNTTESLKPALDQACAESSIVYADFLIANQNVEQAKQCLEWGKTHKPLQEILDRLQKLPATQP